MKPCIKPPRNLSTVSASEMELFHIAFYQLCALPKVEQLARRLRLLAQNLCGSVLLADEGINGMLSGTSVELDRFQQRLQREFPILAAMPFKRTSCAKAPFLKLKIHLKAEVVQIGRPVPSLGSAQQQLMHSLDATAWNALLAQEDVVLVDNRNQFEYALGRFQNALDPKVHRFQDFAEFLEANLPEWQKQGKKFAMYCTGGIRCDKTAAWLAASGIESYTLRGGILGYLQDSSAEHAAWQGECFVFDRRLSLDANLQQGMASEESVYAAPEDAWRLARAKRLNQEDH